jgi:Tfp pilus assembly protein PilX
VKTPQRCQRDREGQRGVASLLVVMLLLFVVSLAAAYASRNLIFEQKTSANQARSTLAFEAAEAGVEWALVQLNGGKVTGTCDDTSPPDSFQRRYLSIAADGFISQQLRSADPAGNLWPTCVFNGTEWVCTCRNNGTSNSIPTYSGSGPFPAFRIWVATPEASSAVASPWGAPNPPRAGFTAVSSVGCTRLPTASADKCLDFQATGDMGEGLAAVRAVLALRSGLAVPPAAAITARRDVLPDNVVPKLIVVNADTSSGGFTVNAGQTLTQKSRFAPQTVAGSPGVLSFADDDSRLASLSTVDPAAGSLGAGDRMFVSIFGMTRETYKQQPGLRTCPTSCTASAINNLLANNPNRIIWVRGNLTLDANIGTATDPVMLIIDGDELSLDTGLSIRGFVYLTGNSSTINLPNAATSIHGALVAEGMLETKYDSTPTLGHELTVTYDRVTLDLLSTTYGSWVRVGGGWRDFKRTP